MKKLIRISAFLALIFFVNVSFTNFGPDNPETKGLLGSWKITNDTIDPIYSGYLGQVTFYGYELIIDSGRFAAAGLVHNSEDTICLKHLSPISYKFIGNKHIYIWWNGQSPSGEIWVQDAMLTIIKRSSKRLTVIGQGGCGRMGAPKISYLKKIDFGIN